MYALFYIAALFIMPGVIVGSWAWLMDARAYRAGWTWTDRAYALSFVGLCLLLVAWVGLMMSLPLPFPGI